MFLNKILAPLLSSNFASNVRNHHVAVIGCASEIGQSVSMMLRDQPSISRLTVQDSTEHTTGVILDLSHIPSNSCLKGYTGNESLDYILKDADIILATGGVPVAPGVSNISWQDTNTEFIRLLSGKISRLDPMPFFCIVTEPINTLVPMAAEILRSHGNFDPRKLFGVTGIDALRAQALYSTQFNMQPWQCVVPVIGGHSMTTTIPLLSQARPKNDFNDKIIHDFTTRVRNAESVVCKAKKGWAPSVSIGYSALVFMRELLNALDGREAQVHAFVENNDFGTVYFAGLVNLDKEGAGEMKRYTDLSRYEFNMLEHGINELRKDVMKGKKIVEMD